MRFIVFWEWDPDDWDTIVARRNKLRAWRDQLPKAEREKRDKQQRQLLPGHYIGGQSKGLTVIETDDPKRLAELWLSYYPEMRMKLVPIFPVEETIEQREDIRRKKGI